MTFFPIHCDEELSVRLGILQWGATTKDIID